MEFSVRRAVIGDEGVLRSLRMQALTDSPSAFSTTLEREMARTPEDWRKWMSPGVTFLLEAAGEPRGLVNGSKDPEDASVALLRAMWVQPEMRGTGAAAALVESVKAWAKEAGAREVRLDVVEKNSRARGCYERAGFCATGRQGVVEKSGDVEIEMVCEL
jgi:GNAT superfamily N-acetyltransferase